MKAEPERQTSVQSSRGGESQVRDGPVAGDLVRDRLLDAPQVDRVLAPDPEGPVEIGGKTAAHHDPPRHGSRDDERGKARRAERRSLRGAGRLEGAPRRTTGDTRAHPSRIGERGIGERREGVERRERTTRAPGAYALPSARCAEALDAELGILSGHSAGRPDGQGQRGDHHEGLHGPPNWKRCTYVTCSAGRNAGAREE